MNVLSKKGGRNHSLVPHSLDSNTIRDSMQYYRVWIYSCNWVLGITSAIFTVFAAFVLADVRLSLLRGVELYHPTFIYAYTALIVQCGVIQVIGCLGAQRLSHKLLSIYWILLLILTIGDVVVGLVWVFKLEDVKLSLRPILTREFIAKYATDADFTKTWNRVQTQEHCCGVNGPLDFDKFSSEVRLQILQEQNVGRTEAALYLSLPESCCTNIDFIPPPTQDYAFGPFSLSRPPDNYSSKSGSVPPTSVPQTPLALFLNSNVSSGEQISSSVEDYDHDHDPVPPLAGLVSIPNVPNNRRRHFVHHRKKFPSNFPGVNGSELNNSLAGGAAASTEEPVEVTEISVPFTCRNPDLHGGGHGHSQHRRNIQIIPSSTNLHQDEDGDGVNDPLTQKVSNSGGSGGTQNSDSGGGGSPLFRKANRRHASIPNPSPNPVSHPTKKTRVRIYRNGCGIKLMQWLDHISGILFILGFCIIGFIKACFLIILRYEIREMIEKIHTLDQVEDGIFSGCNASSPTRLALLQKQSSLSSGQCHFTGVTIKSPQGDGGPKCFHHHDGRNSFVSQASIDMGGRHHHTACCAKGLARDRTGMRRPSGRSLCECDRNSSHSQETVNMTVMITTQQQQKDGGGGSGDERGAESEPISLIVPKQDERDLRRSRFANYAAWDSNVSGESSTSTGGGEFGRPIGKTEVVQVEMENLSSIQFVDESDTSLISVGAPVEEELTKNEEDGTLLIPQPGRLSTATTRRRNGNNNSVDSSDSVMALIGTAV